MIVGPRTYHRLMSRTGSKLYVAVGIASAAAAYLLGASALWSAAIGVVAPIVLAGAPRFLLATVIGALTPGDRETNAAAAKSGMEFEDHVARIARSWESP